jgi:hypothetical protein
MISPFILRFIRLDNKPREEYYYNRLEDAITHYNLFLDDDSGLYRKIEIVDYSEKSIQALEMA